jgi:hypothetical protein
MINSRIREFLKKHDLHLVISPEGLATIRLTDNYHMRYDLNKIHGDIVDDYLIPGFQSIERMRHDDCRERRRLNTVQGVGTGQLSP